MAIKTNVITMRQGNKADYQPSKMLAGELAVINDSEELHFSPKPGKSIRVATDEDLKTKIGKDGHEPNTYLGTDEKGNLAYLMPPIVDLDVDSYLSEISERPVQNKVITKKVKELEKKIEAGSSPGGGTSFSGSAKDVTYDDTETQLGADNVQDAIGKLQEQKADKAYIISVFEELKSLILNGETESAIAVLDEAILDLSTLA